MAMKIGTTSLQASKFAVIGVANTATDFAIFSFLLYVVGSGLIFSNIIAFLVAVSFSYVANKNWTFQGYSSNSSNWTEWVIFLVISLGGLIVATSLLVFLSDYVHVLIAKVIATGGSFIWNFLLVKKGLWRNRAT